MSGKTHRYEARTRWTGNLGTGTSTYRAYSRDHEIAAEGKPAIAGSSDRAFRGDPARWNPEDLLVSALSACHMLSYLHLCAVSGIVVTAYEDRASGEMRETGDGGGRFVSAVLRPRVTISQGDVELARELHEKAHHLCFIAASVDFPVGCEPEIVVDSRREEPA
ncbi:MAG TPA: OsmC family protein [Thermoanaerobaculia bacterium]|nr:OsmC family protein [Thermoanaerobaculia bacterium]